MPNTTMNDDWEPGVWHSTLSSSGISKTKSYETLLKEKEMALAKETSRPLKLKAGFTIGADPELFVVNADGEPVCAYDMIPGSKQEPHKVDGGAVQPDGFAAEFNIDPCTTFEEFNERIVNVMEALKSFIPDDHSFLIAPSVEFSKEQFYGAPPEARILGCDPDFNAYTGCPNPSPNTTDNPTLRTAAGHLHIGFKRTKDYDLSDPQHMMNCIDFVKQLDYYLGAASIRADKDGAVRRSMYGKAGCFRPKEYGVEYRTLSNFWLTSEEARLEVWNRLCRAISDMSQSYLPTRVPANFEQSLIAAIDSNSMNNLEYLEKHCAYPVKSLSNLRSW